MGEKSGGALTPSRRSFQEEGREGDHSRGGEKLKKRKKSGLLAVFLTLSAVGCGILDPGDGVEVRVRNASGIVLDHVTLFLPRETLTYSDLAPSWNSQYQKVAKAYRIATAVVVASQDTARLQVIDFVGETPLEAGRYTYVLRVFGTEPLSIGMDLEKDS